MKAAGLRIEAPETLNFPLSDLSDPKALLELCAQARTLVDSGTPVIYCFEVKNSSDGDVLMRAFRDRLETCSRTGKQLRYSRANKVSGTTALYVGSSKSFASRFSQHLGRTGGPQTYSMRLGAWGANVAASLTVSVWSFDTSVSQEVLELYEQALWDLKKPLLGKRSGK